jgi:hypothetical protein
MTGPSHYVQQWNFNVGHQFGTNTMIQVGYKGLRGTHLPMSSSSGIDINQLPDQDNSLRQQGIVNFDVAFFSTPKRKPKGPEPV